MFYRVILLENIDKSVIKLFESNNFTVEYISDAINKDELIEI